MKCKLASDWNADYVFVVVIHALIEYLSVIRLKFYCAFIDFQKAFDSVWCVGLWKKIKISQLIVN